MGVTVSVKDHALMKITWKGNYFQITSLQEEVGGNLNSN